MDEQHYLLLLQLLLKVVQRKSLAQQNFCSTKQMSFVVIMICETNKVNFVSRNLIPVRKISNIQFLITRCYYS